MDNTRVKAEFIIISEKLSVSEMVDILGVNGDYSGDKSDVLKNGRVRGESFIEFSTDYEESLNISEQYCKIVTKVKSIKESLLAALETGNFCYRFCIVVEIENGDTPAMVLDNEFISLLFELKAEIEFDTYANPYESDF